MRGSYRSRTIDSIVREAHGLAARGVRELLLISQDTSFYGIDRGERGSLARLLRELNKVEGLEWIRLLYLYPTTITDDVLEAMAECEKVCRYVDLPLQHASAAMLKRMRRPGNRAAYDKLLSRIRGRVPGVTLRTTFIVGFPGETETDFAELEAFVEETQFDHVGVFTYSHEEGTRAFALADDVPARVKRKRRDALMARQRRIVAAAQASRTGSEIDVMIDGPSPEHELVLQGRTEGQAPDIDAVVYLTDCDPASYRPGELIRAQIVEARDYDLVAAPVGVALGERSTMNRTIGMGSVSILCCRRGPTPAGSRGAPPPREDRPSGRLLLDQSDGYRRPSADRCDDSERVSDSERAAGAERGSWGPRERRRRGVRRGEAPRSKI